MTIRLDCQVALVEGAGNGLWRSYARALVARCPNMAIFIVSKRIGANADLSGAVTSESSSAQAFGFVRRAAAAVGIDLDIASPSGSIQA
jgi:hypothetical protein